MASSTSRGRKINLVSTTPIHFEKLIIVLPAYNAALTLAVTFADVPRSCYHEIILVDDCRTDNTVEVARSLGMTVIEHDRNRGYGANQKTCYDAALERRVDAVVMLHPDYQYDSRLIPHFLGFMETGVCQVMLGCRIRSRHETLESGMPRYKYICNRGLTFVENIVLGQNLGDFHSGFRCYTRQVLETVPYHKNSDDFVFDPSSWLRSPISAFAWAIPRSPAAISKKSPRSASRAAPNTAAKPS